MMRRLITTVTVVVALLSGVSPAAAAPRVVLPPVTGTADYQLGGSYAVPSGVTVVARDASSRPAPGVYSICYLNGFQTQGGQRKMWLTKHPKAVLRRNGAPVVDPNWPDEMMLDTSTEARRAEIARVFAPTIRSCARKGFAAIEIDNLDSFSRSHGLLTASDNRKLAALFTRKAHALGLAVAQKNTPTYAASFKKKVGFDFAIAEECHRWNECSRYTKVYSRVIDIEYTDDLRGSFTEVCATGSRPAMTILRDRDLVKRGANGYVYRHC
jgi:hypothetical protein